MEVTQPHRIYNFSPGQVCLPIEILKKAKDEIYDWHGSGVSVMEMSHRSAEFTQIKEQTESDLRKFLEIPDNFQIFFMQGGSSLQFTMVVKNLLGKTNKANYLVTGQWSRNACDEAKKLGVDVNEVIAPLPKFASCPDISEWNIAEDAGYFYYTDNETMMGVEFNNFPFERLKNQLIVCDMSSNFCTRKIDWSHYGVVFAGKNVGPSGNTVLVVREDLLGEYEQKDTSLILSWNAFYTAPKGIYNTPCCWSIYMCGLNMAYLNEKGMDKVEEEAKAKADMLYNYIDSSDNYYTNPVDPASRSRVNICFRVKADEELEAKFIKESKAAGLTELHGHVWIGFCRANINNAMPIEGIEALVAFMKKFREDNP